ncbi:Pentatricopeptide repeat-containing protein [Acorus gramineus]|uniref:Pentatricopeptide repeat-containing protein n=1 Tax=Acorus gramineus TaxID=55184 RepID=A0AAV9BNL6_ACOGR|nr:Pentatricopeptide repeat-containing protein [Acorus gramineus]
MRNVHFTLTHTNLSSLLSFCAREGHFRLAASIHAAILKNPVHIQSDGRDAVITQNSLISMYSKRGRPSDAIKVFDEMKTRDTVSHNSIISARFHAGDFEDGLARFGDLHRSTSVRFDHATLTTVLSALAEREMLCAARTVHAIAVSSGLTRETAVGNALVTAYFNCGCPASAARAFDEVPARTVVTWTAAVSGLALNAHYEEALALFSEMHACASVSANSSTYSSALLACCGARALRDGRRIHGLVLKSGHGGDLRVASALMDVYSKCGETDDAIGMFESSEELDEVALTVVLACLAQNGSEESAFELFASAHGAGFDVDPNMFSAVLGAFGVGSSYAFAKQTHALVVKKGLDSNVFVCNGLVNAYSKCGDIADSVNVFVRTARKNSVSYNSMIAALARHGRGDDALRMYDDMRAHGVALTDVTFLSLLHACSHIGCVETGFKYLRAMSEVYGMTPRAEHYACVVDMLGRAGRLREAKRFVEGLAMTENSVEVWQALLGVCGIHGDMEMGRRAAEKVVGGDLGCAAGYVVMANICSAERDWRGRGRVLRRMKESGVRKETGMSWVEVGKATHRFRAGDDVHPQAEAIREAVVVLAEQIAEDECEGWMLYEAV